METLVKLNGQTAGRDKIARLLQYLSRLLWYRLQQKYGVHGLKNLEYQLSTFRKLLRFGRCIDSLHAALLLQGHPNKTIRLTVSLSKISNALFLFADHILWLGRADLCNIKTDKWSRISNKYWLLSIVMNLARDSYEIKRILQAHHGVIVPKGGCKNLNDVFKASGRAFLQIQKCPDVFVDTVKNCCDLLIPMNALGHINLSPGTIGLFGVISSIAGLIALIEPSAKLSPV